MSSNGHHAPIDFPPPVDPVKEFIKRDLDGEDERIDVGVAIVGGGTAGLACANRLLQLLAEDEALMERLGEVPVAVIEKAKTCGGHNLSGAVMRPGPLQELFPDLSREDWRKKRFAFGEVTKESVYMLPTAKTKVSVPIPFVPNFKNHGNEIVSVAALARYQAQQAEEGGAYILTETSATQLIVEDGKVVGCPLRRQGPRQGRRAAGQLRARHRHQCARHGPRRGCWGHLTGAAIKEFDLGDGREPQVWELGVKEVWKVKKPLGPGHPHLQPAVADEGLAQVRAARRHLDLSDEGREDRRRPGVDRLRGRPQLPRRHHLRPRPAPDLQDPSLVKGILDGGERVAWGAKALPGGGYWSMPKLSMPGAVLVGDAGGMVDTAALKGVHHCIKSGKLAAEAIFQHLQTGVSLESYEQAVEDSSIGKELYQVRNARQAFQKGFIKGSLLAGPAIMSKGKVPPGRQSWHRDDAEPLFVGDTRDAYPKPDGKYTFDKLSLGLHQRQRHPRRRAQPHPRCTATSRGRSPRAGATCAPRASTRSPTTRPRPARRRDRQLHQLRAVRGDHRQGRTAHPARGRRRAAVHHHLVTGFAETSGLPGGVKGARMKVRRLVTGLAAVAALSRPPPAGRVGVRRHAAAVPARRLHLHPCARPGRAGGRRSRPPCGRSAGTRKMAMRFELLQRSPGLPVQEVSGGDLGAWRTPPNPTLGQLPGDVWRLQKSVYNLAVPFTYQFRVTFRWTGLHGKVLGTATRYTHTCRSASCAPTSPSSRSRSRRSPATPRRSSTPRSSPTRG